MDKTKAHTNKAEDYNVKQTEVNGAILKAKLVEKIKVEHLLATNKMKDARNELSS